MRKKLLKTLIVVLLLSMVGVSQIPDKAPLPSLDNFESLGEKDLAGETFGFFVNKKDAVRKDATVSFEGLLARMIDDSLDPTDWSITTFKANCNDYSVSLVKISGIVKGKQGSYVFPPNSRKPDKDSAIYKAIIQVCEYKVGIRVRHTQEASGRTSAILVS